MIEQNAHGRWFWGLITSNNEFTAYDLKCSTVTFAHAADAEFDFQEHSAAMTDMTGRLIRSKTAIRNLIRAAAYDFPEWQNSYFGEVHWQRADAAGCNWNLSSYRGSNWTICLESIRPYLEQLHAAYNIPDEH
jgi:hypothetical protein